MVFSTLPASTVASFNGVIKISSFAILHFNQSHTARQSTKLCCHCIGRHICKRMKFLSYRRRTVRRKEMRWSRLNYLFFLVPFFGSRKPPPYWWAIDIFYLFTINFFIPIPIFRGFTKFGIKVLWSIQFLGYLRTLSLKFQKAQTKIVVVLSLPWNCSLHNTLIPNLVKPLM